MPKKLENVNDIVGREFGKLKVLAWSRWEKNNHYYQCLCQCGRIAISERANLIYGNTKSCSCFHAKNDNELRDIIMRIPHNENGCRIFPGGKNSNGYGVITYEGKNHTAHAQSARLFIGERPEGLVVMHACAVKACCEPKHLSYGTHSQNLKDSYDHEGRTGRNSKLNLDQAREIRALYPKMTMEKIAERFSCSHNHIYKVVNNKRWHEPRIAPPEDRWSSENHFQATFNF